MASWRDNYAPVDVTDKRDNLGRPVDVISDQAEVLLDRSFAPSPVAAPTTPQAEPAAPATPSWRDSYTPAAQEAPAATGTWRDAYSPVSSASAAVRPELPTGEPATGLAAFAFLDEFKKGTLTKEKSMADPRVINAMKTGLDFRFGDRGLASNLATGLAGGAIGGYTKDMSNEDIFEQWQNWMRSFAGGQTVTTANEIAFLSTLDDEEKSLLGAQYEMFDKNPNIFSAETGWGEMFDGIKDYASAAVWDPLTLVSLGVGKALGAGATKTAGLAVRSAAQTAFRSALKKGMSREAAVAASQSASKAAFVRVGLVDASKYAAVDFVANVSTDIAYQSAMMDTGVQDEYQLSQTVMAGMATMLLPAIVGGSRTFSAWSNSANAPAPFKAAVGVHNLFKGLGKEDILAAQKARVNFPQVESEMGNLLKNFGENSAEYTDWSKVAGDARASLGGSLDATDNEKLFMRSFLFGSPKEKGGAKGFVNVMSDAGLVFVEREDTNITNFIGDAINFLPADSTIVADFVKTFQREFGSISKNVDNLKTPKELSEFWKGRQSAVGSRLWDSKQSSVLISRGITDKSTNSALADAMNREISEKTKKTREAGKYTLSLYKSLLTSHISTTMLNVKGWAATSAAGTVSDVIQGTLELMTAPAIRVLKGEDAYSEAIKAGRGSISGALRRGVNFLQPGDTIEKALEYMKYSPQTFKALSRDLGGDSGAAAGVDTLKRLGMDPKDKVNLGLESTRNLFQALSGQKLQDETTKMLSFMSNVDLMIRREYGMDYNSFMTDPKLGFVEMHSPRYRNIVEANALDRTQREVYSKDWTSKKGSSLALNAARYMEGISANEVGGYVIPFGKFFNNSMAMMSDYSGVNAVRILGGKYLLGKKSTTLAAEETSQLLAKATVGITAAYMMSDQKMSNLAEGLKWNQQREDDGSITDKTYEFPESMLHLVGQLIAHYRKDEQIPPELAAEAVDFTIGQTFRGASDAVQVMDNLAKAIASGDLGSSGKQALNIAFGSLARIASGATRPLDMPNQAIKLATGDWVEPDRNTNGDSWTDFSLTKKATRYFDEFFEAVGLGADGSPNAAKPTSPYQQAPDAGRVVGTRTTPGNSKAEQLMNSVGIPSWQAFRWGNDPEVKNHMNALVGPVFEAEAAQIFREHPDFFDLPLYNRQVLVEGVLKRSREQTQSWMESEGGDFSYRDRLAKVNKNDLKLTLDRYYPQVKGNPLKLLKEENGLETLISVIGFAENYQALGMADN
jgi:hypothetical protein